jgi:serine/threonine protein kinase
LGITLVELATGEYPYKHCNTEFEVMSTILTCDAPKLVGDHFTDKFKSFVNLCLTKDYLQRPKYNILLKHPFVQHYKQTEVDVKSWFQTKTNSTQANLKNENSKSNTSLELFVEEKDSNSLASTPTVEKSSNNF